MTRPIYDIQYYVDRPCLLIDEETVRQNIDMMVSKAQRNKVSFRPHFKTHQSETIGEWFWEAGVRKITVSSLQMANYFADAGWTDITISTPVNLLQIRQILDLAKDVDLNVVIDNVDSAIELSRQINVSLGVFIEIDTGNKRTGLLPTMAEEIVSACIALKDNKYISCKGFLVHSGHTYRASNKSEIELIYREDRNILLSLKNDLQYLFEDDLQISIGDTPGCVTVDEFNWADEIRPGNFVFFDLMQWINGICNFQDIGCLMACPVISVQRHRKEILIYGGAAHFSKDSLIIDGQDCFGLVAHTHENDPYLLKPDKQSKLVQLWQEHGLVKASDELLANTNVGDLIFIYPVHSCLTLDAIRYCRTVDGQWIRVMSK